MKNHKLKNELFLLLTIIILALFIGIRNPVFFTTVNFVSIIRNLIINGIMAFAVMLGIIIGGIDVSFPAIAVVSMYITNRYAESVNYSSSAVWLFVMAMSIGLLLGLINGFLITKFKLPAFIVTLGTSSVFYGLLISTLGGKQVNRLVTPLEAIAKADLFRVNSGVSTSAMPVTVLVLIAIMMVVYFILNRTMQGRMIYAIGGDKESARKAGFPVEGITVLVYGFIGLVSGLAGICHSIQSRMCIPTDLMGSEMIIIAMVVLGGTKISGGKGTVLGTFLGVFLITMVRSSLILVGIPSVWQEFITGAIIVAGTGISAYQVLKDGRKLPPVM